MTTLRVARRRQFVTLDARAVNDSRLSFRARGLHAWLLEKPDSWTINASAIAERGKEGRDAVRAALAELELAGYMRRRRYRDERGVWRSEAVVFEHPDLASQAVDNSGDKPGTMTENQGWLPDAGFPGAITNIHSQDSNADDAAAPKGAAPPAGNPDFAAARRAVGRTRTRTA